MSDTSKKATDKILFLLPIAIIAAFFIHTWWTNAAPTKLAVGLTFAGIILVSTFGALITKDIGVHGFWLFKKEEKPALFWAEFVGQLLLIVAILLYALN